MTRAPAAGRFPGRAAPSRASAGPAAATSAPCCCRPASPRARCHRRPYNHYTMLRQRRGHVRPAASGLRRAARARPTFGADIFNRSCGCGAAGGPSTLARRCTPARPRHLAPPPLSARIPLRWSGGSVLHRAGPRHSARARRDGGHWRPPPTSTLAHLHRCSSAQTYTFQVRRQHGRPDGQGGHHRHHRRARAALASGQGPVQPGLAVASVRGAWQQHAIQATSPAPPSGCATSAVRCR